MGGAAWGNAVTHVHAHVLLPCSTRTRYREVVRDPAGLAYGGSAPTAPSNSPPSQAGPPTAAPLSPALQGISAGDSPLLPGHHGGASVAVLLQWISGGSQD